jgi:hypothetical protein
MTNLSQDAIDFLHELQDRKIATLLVLNLEQTILKEIFTKLNLTTSRLTPPSLTPTILSFKF